MRGTVGTQQEPVCGRARGEGPQGPTGIAQPGGQEPGASDVRVKRDQTQRFAKMCLRSTWTFCLRIGWPACK